MILVAKSTLVAKPKYPEILICCMADEKEGEIVPIDPQTELEALKTKQQILEVQKDIQKGWQEIVRENLPEIIKVWKESSSAEYKSFLTLTKWTLGTVIFLYIIIGGLTYTGRIQGESLVFMTGIIVGYMLSLISSKFKKEPES